MNALQGYLLTSEVPERLGNVHPTVSPVVTFRASDGWFILTAGNDGQYRRVREAVGRPDLWEDERLKTDAGRLEHREEIGAELAALFRPRDGWIRLLNEVGVPVCPVYDLAEALADLQTEARGVVWRVPHPGRGAPNRQRAPAHEPHLRRARRSPPLLGKHTREVLGQALGLQGAELDDLEADGAIACGTS